MQLMVELGKLRIGDRFRLFGKLMVSEGLSAYSLSAFKPFNPTDGTISLYAASSELVEPVVTERCQRCHPSEADSAVGRVQGIPMCPECLKCFHRLERRPL
jgi:hypothetical protein